MLLTSVATLLLLGAAPARHDVYYEQITSVSRNGKPLGPGIASRVWYSGRRMRVEAGEALQAAPLILRLDRREAYRLDPARKVAVRLDLEAMRARSQLDLSTAGDLLGGADDGRVRTSALPTPKTLAGHACRGYRIRSPTAQIDIYVASDLPVGVEAFAEFLEWSGASQALGAVLDEIRKLPGFPMQTRARVSVLGEEQETLSTVTRVRVGPHAASLFEPPAGWTVEQEEPEEE
jgi:hypothetical protein